MLDLAAEAAAQPLTEVDIRLLQAMKTGALLHYAVTAGGMMGGAGPEAAAALSEFGHKLGAAFQIADDLLDFTGDAALMGKKVGKDAARNKATLVARLGLEAAADLSRRLAGEAKAALERLVCPESKAILLETVDFVVSRRS